MDWNVPCALQDEAVGVGEVVDHDVLDQNLLHPVWRELQEIGHKQIANGDVPNHNAIGIRKVEKCNPLRIRFSEVGAELLLPV